MSSCPHSHIVYWQPIQGGAEGPTYGPDGRPVPAGEAVRAPAACVYSANHPGKHRDDAGNEWE